MNKNLETSLQKIEKLKKLSEELSNSQSELNTIHQQLIIAKECEENDVLTEEIEQVYSIATEYIASVDITDYTADFATSASASSISATTQLSGYLTESDEFSENDKYQEIYSEIVEWSIDSNNDTFIIEKLQKIDNKLGSLFKTVINTFNAWRNNSKSGSDLAKDIRNFIEKFKGILNLPRQYLNNKKKTDFSWPKMAENAARTGKQNHKGLLNEKGNYEKLHSELSQILKENKEYESSELKHLFILFKNHIYAILGFIDIEKISKLLSEN